MADILNQGYRDLDGNHRNFTVIDHDKKTKINTSLGSNMEQLEKDIQESRVILQNKILALPASACSVVFDDFRTRSEDGKAILWNETMIKDPSIPLTQLMDIYTLTSNKVEMVTSGVRL